MILIRLQLETRCSTCAGGFDSEAVVLILQKLKNGSTSSPCPVLLGHSEPVEG